MSRLSAGWLLHNRRLVPFYESSAFEKGREEMTVLKSTRIARRVMAVCVTGLVATASVAQARQPLSQVEEIDQNMLWVAIAAEIGERCSSIDARMVKGLLFLNQLRNDALAMGYTKEEIEEYATADEERVRWRELGENYAKSLGLNPDDTADLCKLGELEIARSSQIGVLLKEK